MTEIARYRGTQRLAAPALTRLALQIVQEMAVFGPGGMRNLEAQADALSAAGVGLGDSAHGGYDQILAMTGGLLLVGAGASVNSAADTVRDRPAQTLETLIANVLGRMRAAPPMERPGPPASSSVPPAAPTPVPRKVESAGHPAVGLSDAAAPAPSADESVVFGDAGSTPLAFLNSRLDEGLRRVVRNAQRVPSPTTGNHLATPVSASGPIDRRAVARAAGHELEIAQGVVLTVDADTAARLAEPAARAELIRAFALALERHFR